MMLDLLKNKDGLIMTKFLSKIWRRYSFFSTRRALFIQRRLRRFAPDYKFSENLILDRTVISLEDDEPLDEDEDEDEDNKDEEASTSEEKSKTEEKN